MASEAERLETAARSLRREAATIVDRISSLRTQFDQAVHGCGAPWQAPSANRAFETIDRRNTQLQKHRKTMEWLAWRMEREARTIRQQDEEAKRRAAALVA